MVVICQTLHEIPENEVLKPSYISFLGLSYHFYVIARHFVILSANLDSKVEMRTFISEIDTYMFVDTCEIVMLYCYSY